MKRLLLVIGGLWVAALTSCSDAPPGRTIVLISLDSVRADALDFSGRYPNLALLADKATRFDQAYSASSWTLPTHATMFTGAEPQLHGVEFDDLAIDPQWATLPQVLKDGGWSTDGWYTGWYTAGDFGFARGFDSYNNAMTGGRQIEAQVQSLLAKNDVTGAQQLLAGREVMGHRDITTPNVMSGFDARVAGATDSEDLFLFTHLFDPHYDYLPPSPFDTLFDPDYQGTITGNDYYANHAIYDPTRVPARQINDRDLKHIMALYLGEIAYVDHELGRMFDALKKAGRYDDALIIVTADHGEEFFEHGNRGHRVSLFDEVLHIPLLIRDPRHLEAQIVQTQVGQTDLMPTILSYAGLPIPDTVTGRDLSPALRGEPLESKPVLSSLMQHHPEHGYLFVESWRVPERKLIRTMTTQADGQLKLLDWNVYDLKADPIEAQGVEGPDAKPRDFAEWRSLQARLDELRALWAAAPQTPPSERATMLREVIQGDLAGLGYTEGTPAQEGAVSPGLGLPWPPGPRPKL